MSPNRVLQTTVFRLSLAYAAGFSLLAAAALAFTYWSIAEHAQRQVDDVLRAESEDLQRIYRSRGLSAIADVVARRGSAGGQERLRYLLEPKDGGEPVGDLQPLLPDMRVPDAANATTIYTVQGGSAEKTGGGGTYPIRILTTLLPDGRRLRVGHEMHAQRAILAHAVTVVSTTAAITAGVTLVVGIIMGLRVLRRIEALNRTASDIIAGNLSLRLPLSTRRDEFDALSYTVNRMLDRIDRLVAGMREVTDNVAHDFRTPLNRLRSALEVSLLESRPEPEYRSTIEGAIEEAGRLLRTLNGMLSLARLEAGTREVEFEHIDLSELASDLGDFYEGAAEERGLTLALDVTAEIDVRGDRQLLAQALSNLLDNAIKYTGPGGLVSLCVKRQGSCVVLRVSDTGPGIPIEEHQHVLGRFVRLDNARTTPGNGLGLSLVKAAADHHAARLVLENTRLGLQVSLEFPRAVDRLPSRTAIESRPAGVQETPRRINRSVRVS